jgi:hypothetical protein
MSLRISKNIIYQFLFVLCVGVTYIDNYELTFAVWITTLLLTIKRKYSLNIISYCIPFLLILAVAFFSSFANEPKLFEFIRDVTYFVKPILGLLIGYQLCRSKSIKPFETIIYTGLIIAIIHLGIIFYSAIIYRIVNIHELRHYSGYFSDFEFYALTILIFRNKFGLDYISKKRVLFLFLIIGFSAILYVSRTNFIQLALFYIVLKGYFSLKKKSLIVVGLFAFFAVVGYSIIYNMNLSRNGKGVEALLFKIKNAPIEPFKTKVNKNDWQDFNDNFRSYENIITIRQVTNEGLGAIFFGKGLGATVDYGRKMFTNDGTFIRHAPVLHNAYTTVFLKSGVLGLIFLILFLIYLVRQKKSKTPIINQLNLLIIATAIFLILSNWVLLGLFLKIDNKAIILGFLICYKEFLLKENAIKNEA